jgi:hypothetical protein
MLIAAPVAASLFHEKLLHPYPAQRFHCWRLCQAGWSGRCEHGCKQLMTISPNHLCECLAFSLRRWWK